MKYLNTNYYRNITVLAAVFVFASFGFFGNIQSVNAESELEFESTPAKKKATPTPKKATPTPKKTTAKTTPKPTPKKTTAKATPKPTPKKTTAKATPTPNRNTKTTANKKPTPTPAKKTNTRTTATPKPTTVSKTNANTTNRNTRTTMATPTPKPRVNNRTTSATTNVAQTNTVLSKIVINALSVTVRSSANSSASEMTRARLGSTYSVVEKKSGWYRVQLANQRTGWIAANFATDSNPNGNEEVYRQILAKNYKAEKSTFTEAAEIFDFLTRILPEIKTANTAAEFGLTRLLSLRYALNAIPRDNVNEKLYQDFLKAQDENIVYSEPAADWYVRAPLFWDLHSKYTNTPAGEQIAWEGARTLLPGECEGYVNCYIFVIRMTDGEYLNYYPNGKYSAESLRNIINFLEPIAADAQEKKVYNGPTETGDRAEFNSLITELRVILSRMPNVEKEKALGQLKKIADGFR